MSHKLNNPRDASQSTNIDFNKINPLWLNSGLSQKEFCSKNHINYKSFTKWRSKEIQSGRVTGFKIKSKKQTVLELKNSIKKFIPIKINPKRETIEPNKIQSRQSIELHLPHHIMIKIPV